MTSEYASTIHRHNPQPQALVAQDDRRYQTLPDNRSDRGTELLRRRVLVVDDDAAIRLLLRTYLTRSGLIVEVASDGADAIRKLQTCSYDAVITDLMMPNVDGLGVVAFMEEEQPQLLRRTVVLTAYPQLATDRQLNSKVTVLSKPFDLNNLGTLLVSLSELETI